MDECRSIGSNMLFSFLCKKQFVSLALLIYLMYNQYIHNTAVFDSSFRSAHHGAILKTTNINLEWPDSNLVSYLMLQRKI